MLAIFSLGGGEIILILAIVLILFGAKRLPELAKGLGQGINEFKKATATPRQDCVRRSKTRARPDPEGCLWILPKQKRPPGNKINNHAVWTVNKSNKTSKQLKSYEK